MGLNPSTSGLRRGDLPATTLSKASFILTTTLALQMVPEKDSLLGLGLTHAARRAQGCIHAQHHVLDLGTRG